MRHIEKFGLCIWIAFAVAACSETSSNNDTQDIPQGMCKEGTFACQGKSMLMNCSHGTWMINKTCASSQICDESLAQCVEQSDLPETQIPDDSPCVAGTRRCYPALTGIEVCADGVWQAETSCSNGMLCNPVTLKCEDTSTPQKPSDACIPGSRQCDVDGSRVLACANGVWLSMNNCNTDAHQFCDPATLECRQGCTQGDIKCNTDATAVMECNQNAWTTKATCSADETCSGTTKSCEKNVECVNGDSYCDDDQVMLCSDYHWTKGELCQNGASCFAGECVQPAVTCTDGTSQCLDETHLSQCINGRTIHTDCTAEQQMCFTRDGESQCEAVVCTENACKDANTQLVCNTALNTLSGQACPNHFICDDIMKTCVPRVCEENQYRCANNNLEKCTNNAWMIKESCNSSQMCSDSKKQCISVVCTDGDTRCNSKGKLETCSNNAFGNATTCSGDTPVCKESSAASAACVSLVCIDDTYQCDGAQLQKCVENQWVTQSTCDSAALCSANGTTGSCKAKECENGAEGCSNSKASTKICKDYKWEYTLCSSVQEGSKCSVSNGKASCGMQVCTDGYSCDGNTLKKCENNTYTNSKDCGSSAICDASAGKCVSNECAEGNYSCNLSTLRKCESGQWVDKATCTADQTCDATAQKCVVHECESYEYKCESKKLYNCKNHKWNEIETCSSSQTCDSSLGMCVSASECTSGYKCQDNDLYECQSGSWKLSKDCQAGETCNSYAGVCAQCGGNSYQCDGQDLYNCRDFVWVKQQTCNDDEKCMASYYGGGCVPTTTQECTNNQYQCKDQVLQICSGGKWTTSKTCTDKQTCFASGSNGSCVDNLSVPEWCNIQWVVDEKYDRGYGRIQLPDDISEDQISAEMICGNLSSPVKDWYTATAYKNTNCTDCGTKTEYLSAGMNASAGTLACAYRFNFGLQSYICKKGGGAPIVMTSSTKLTADDTYPITINSISSSEKPSWCWFKHLENEHGNYGEAYLHVFPGELNGGQITAEFLCGSPSTPVMHWSVMSRAIENVFCDSHTCGDNIEYMTIPRSTQINSSQKCTFRIQFGSLYQICPIDEAKGNEMITVTPSTGTLPAGYYRP